MTPPLTWNDSWLLGIGMLDAGHREMVRLINRLADADVPAALAERIGDLIAHVRGHFRLEEEFLVSIDYPARDQHRREHALQLAELVDLKRSIACASPAPVVLDGGSLGEIKCWFFNHVVAEDRRFADYYHDVVCARHRVAYRAIGAA